jgi:hypothetical protein
LSDIGRFQSLGKEHEGKDQWGHQG